MFALKTGHWQSLDRLQPQSNLVTNQEAPKFVNTGAMALVGLLVLLSGKCNPGKHILTSDFQKVHI